MQITDIVKDSIEYPLRDWSNFVLLMVLIISCIFIIPIPLLVGYNYRIINETIRGNNSLPNFHELAEMYVDGLKVILAMLVYGLVSFIISTILIVIANAMGGFGAALFALLNQIFTIFISIFSLFAIANMALCNNWAAIFDVKSIWEICSNIGLKRILAWYCILLIMSLFAIVTGILSILFFIVPVIILIWLSVYEYRSLGLLIYGIKENIENEEFNQVNEDLELVEEPVEKLEEVNGELEEQ